MIRFRRLAFVGLVAATGPFAMVACSSSDSPSTPPHRRGQDGLGEQDALDQDLERPDRQGDDEAAGQAHRVGHRAQVRAAGHAAEVAGPRQR